MMFQSPADNERRWAAKTITDVKEIAQTDGSVLIVPVGSLEQHGPHMPTCTDSLLCDEIAQAGVKKLDDDIPVLVTPPVWTGLSPHHLPLGATISIQVETMLAVLADVASTSLENGFDAILFLNGHGGNMGVISACTKVIGPEYPNVDVLALSYFMLAEPYIDGIRDSSIGGFGHAGEFETSLMLYLHPELVYEECIEDDHREARYELQPKDLLARGPLSVYETAADTGVLGDPTHASVEKGEAIYDVLGDELAELLEEIHAENSQ